MPSVTQRVQLSLSGTRRQVVHVLAVLQFPTQLSLRNDTFSSIWAAKTVVFATLVFEAEIAVVWFSSTAVHLIDPSGVWRLMVYAPKKREIRCQNGPQHPVREGDGDSVS